jgi:hypothetical protein
MAQKCEHCGIEPKDHSINWMTSKPGDPGRPDESGPEWGIYRLWTGVSTPELIGVVCSGCWASGRRFKDGFGGCKEGGKK